MHRYNLKDRMALDRYRRQQEAEKAARFIVTFFSLLILVALLCACARELGDAYKKQEQKSSPVQYRPVIKPVVKRV